MSIFIKHNENTAPKETASVLESVKQRYGFIPNLAAFVAESPQTLSAILKLSEAFDQTSLSSQEQQVVLLTVSTLNECSYCKTVHIALGKKANLDNSTIDAIVSLQPLEDKKLNALRNFTRALVERKGKLHEEDLQAFRAAGFTRAQIFEVVMGVSLKTMTNYCNHLANAEPNKEFVEMAKTSSVS